MIDITWFAFVLCVLVSFVCIELCLHKRFGTRGTLSYRIWMRARRHPVVATLIIAALALVAWVHFVVGWPMTPGG